MMLKECYNCVTMGLEWCYNGAKLVLQWCYNNVTSPMCSLIFICQHSHPYIGVTIVLQLCYNGVTMMSQWCYTGVTIVSQWGHNGVKIMLQWWCYESRVFAYIHLPRKKACI
jgi:hypothetical protein